MEPSLHLRSGAYAAAVGGDLAVLDIRSDAYLCLPGGASALREENRHRVRPGTACGALRAADLLSDLPRAPEDPPPRPRRSVIHDPCERRPGSRLIAIAAAAALEVRRARRLGGLTPYLAVADTSRLLSRDPESVERAARQFWSIGPWMPIEGECLVRSAVLVAFLRRLGLAADWVFAVRLWPFSAHCWVQLGDACLNDDVERLAPFTPIYSR